MLICPVGALFVLFVAILYLYLIGDCSSTNVFKSAYPDLQLQLEGACDMEKLNAWLSKLLSTQGADLFRSKGVLCIHGSPDKHVFQGVHMLLDMESSASGNILPWASGW
jgi:hypothetical protein